jgi:hypothetical protein
VEEILFKNFVFNGHIISVHIRDVQCGLSICNIISVHIRDVQCALSICIYNSNNQIKVFGISTTPHIKHFFVSFKFFSSNYSEIYSKFC